MDKMDEVRTWITYSDNDAEAVRQLSSFHPPQIEIICYLCQQSAEKILKSFLVYSDIKPIKTHDLELLRDECEKIDEQFTEITSECARLNDYSSQPRYPSGLELIKSDMDLAINDSMLITNLVKDKIILDKS